MKLIFSLTCLLFSTVLATAADWTTDYPAALIQSQAQHKLVLLDFTGSDWCGYCKLLEKEVFTTQDFKDFADKNYILVTLDFPHDTPLPANLQQQNQGLAQQFKIDGYPTLIVVNSSGTELGREVGYDPGSGPQAVLQKLQGFK